MIIEAAQAFLIALQAAQQAGYQNHIGNVAVNPQEDHYEVVLTPLIAGDEIWTILVNGDTGEATAVTSVPLERPAAPNAALPSLTALEAYQRALVAIKGYERHDKMGPLTIEFVEPVYRVTFPEQSDEVGLTADFIYQIWIEGRSAEVVKIRVAS